MKKRIRHSICFAVVLIPLAAGCIPPGDDDGDGLTIERVSVSENGNQGDFFSTGPSISSDGRYVAFDSGAGNLVPGDTNNTNDIFVCDRRTGAIERVSLGTGGVQANNLSGLPSISADGRCVAFYSHATNLVPGDTNAREDIFVYDRQTGVIERVSIGTGGVQANNWSLSPSISADGRYVAFESAATNLVTGDTNSASDIFVYDRQGGAIERVSLGAGGVQANNLSSLPSISADGRYVAFDSNAWNLVTGDTNSTWDIFVYDRQAGAIERVSVGAGGIQANNGSGSPSISTDGRYVAFESAATNLVPGDTIDVTDIFVYDRQTGAIERVSLGTGGVQADNLNRSPSLSGDGRYVAFESEASNLVPGDTNDVADVFVYDRKTARMKRVNVSGNGTQGDDASGWCKISTDGTRVAFQSAAANLVPGDTNGCDDVFVTALQ